MIINDKKYELKFTGKTLLIYKEEFHEDLLLKISKMKDLSNDIAELLKIVWAMAKTSDNSMAKCNEWLDQFSMFEITKIINENTVEEILSTITKDSNHTVELKKK